MCKAYLTIVCVLWWRRSEKERRKMQVLYESIDQLNETVRLHKRNNQLNDTDRAVLDVLARYSCKVIGKSWLAKSTIAELVGKSRRTIIRVCKKLESLGIIRQYERKRATGDRRQTSNLIVILPAVEPAQEKNVTAECHTQETPERNYKTNYLVNTYSQASKYVKQTHYDKFREFILTVLGNVEKRLIYRLYSVYRAHSVPLLRLNAFDRQTVEQIGLIALKTTLTAIKRKKIRNLAGYYNGVLDRMLDRLFYETVYGIA